jgi:hypothetical protein
MPKASPSPKRAAKSPARAKSPAPAKSTPPTKAPPPTKQPEKTAAKSQTPSPRRLKRAGYAALFLAILLGLIGRLAPTLLLRIPTYGWIFWMATGNPVPPYLVLDAWKGDEHRSWLRDGDLVVAAGGKSGTTWMLYCAHQIRVKGSDDVEYGDISLSSPWPELIQRPGATWEQHKAELNTTITRCLGYSFRSCNMPLRLYWDKPYTFRVWKSHATPRATGGVLPVRERPKVRFLAMARNGLDVVASLVPFFNQHTEEFRTMWGGFPPASSGDPAKDAATRLDDLLPGGMMADAYWKYVKQWWPMRDEPNVLLLHYSDVKRDLAGAVSRIASWLGVELTDDERAKVVEKCGITHMKAHPERFVYELPLNPEYGSPGINGVMHPGSMTRKGVDGDGRVTFSAEQAARWAAAEETEFADAELREWARRGRGSI